MTSPWFERDPAAFAELERTLRARYPTLHAFIEDGRCELRGTLAPVDGDRYQLRIALPDTYPRSLPSIFETGGRIPQTIDRHVFPSGALCLGVPLALWIALRGDFRIGNVIEGPLRSYLIGNSLVEQGEPWPHGDRSHGAAGILEHFGEFIGTTDALAVSGFLIDLLQGKVRGHWLCPCGSGNIVRKCHREAVEVLRSVPPSILMHAIDTILNDLKRQREAA